MFYVSCFLNLCSVLHIFWQCVTWWESNYCVVACLMNNEIHLKSSFFSIYFRWQVYGETLHAVILRVSLEMCPQVLGDELLLKALEWWEESFTKDTVDSRLDFKAVAAGCASTNLTNFMWLVTSHPSPPKRGKTEVLLGHLGNCP